MERLKVEKKQMYKGPQGTKIKGGFRRPNNIAPLTMHTERGRDREDQRIQAPFQNNLVVNEEEREIDELEPEIQCLEDTPPFPHLSQVAYEESLMDSQLNELRKGDKASGGRGRYNSRSEKNIVAPKFLEQSTRKDKPANEVANSHRSKKAQPLSPIVHNHFLEIREIPKLTSCFNFEHEIQNIRIPAPLTELIKHEGFEKCFSEIL